MPSSTSHPELRQVEDVAIGPRSCVGVDGILIGSTDLLEDHSINAGPARQGIVARAANAHHCPHRH